MNIKLELGMVARTNKLRLSLGQVNHGAHIELIVDRVSLHVFEEGEERERERKKY